MGVLGQCVDYASIVLWSLVYILEFVSKISGAAVSWHPHAGLNTVVCNIATANNMQAAGTHKNFKVKDL